MYLNFREKFKVGEPSLEPPPEPKWPRCPVCNEETDTFFKNKDGYVVGCDNCIEPYDAWDEVREDY